MLIATNSQDNTELDQGFAQFMTVYAKSWSPLAHMKDDPADAPIRLPPGPIYNRAALKTLRGKMTRLRKMNFGDLLDGSVKKNEKEFRKLQKLYEEKLEKYTREKQHLQNMLLKVQAWVAPSDEHEKFRKFVIEQLQREQEHFEKKPTPPDKKTAIQFLLKEVEELQWMINHHETAVEDGMKLYNSKSQWIRTLCDDLGIEIG